MMRLVVVEDASAPDVPFTPMLLSSMMLDVFKKLIETYRLDTAQRLACLMALYGTCDKAKELCILEAMQAGVKGGDGATDAPGPMYLHLYPRQGGQQ